MVSAMMGIHAKCYGKGVVNGSDLSAGHCQTKGIYFFLFLSLFFGCIGS